MPAKGNILICPNCQNVMYIATKQFSEDTPIKDWNKYIIYPNGDIVLDSDYIFYCRCCGSRGKGNRPTEGQMNIKDLLRAIKMWRNKNEPK